MLLLMPECGPMSGRGTDAGSADHSNTPPTEQCSVAVGEKIKRELDAATDAVKSELEDAEVKMPIGMASTPAESEANSTAPSDLDTASAAAAADVGKQDDSDVKSEDPALKEEDDAMMDNDDQNADGKQSAQYWNYHWPKVCDKFYK